MLQIRGDLDLGEEAFDAEHRSELGFQDFDGDATIVAHVAREIDRRHAAGADLALDVIPAGQGSRELCRGIHVQKGCETTELRSSESVIGHG